MQITNFPALLIEAEKLISERVLPSAHKNATFLTVNNCYSPAFIFGIKDNEIKCMWVNDFAKDRVGRPKKDGTCTVFSVADITAGPLLRESGITEGFTPKEWDQIGLALIELHEQLEEKE